MLFQAGFLTHPGFFVPSQSKRPVASSKNVCSKMLKLCIKKAGFTVAGTVPASHRIPSHRLQKPIHLITPQNY